jgi:hypothetical protein
MKALMVVAIALVTALTAAPAYSQSSSGRQMKHPDPPNDSAKKKADDKAYSDALSTVPVTKEYDPWASVREKDKTPAPPKKTGR